MCDACRADAGMYTGSEQAYAKDEQAKLIDDVVGNLRRALDNLNGALTREQFRMVVQSERSPPIPGYCGLVLVL